MCVCSRARVSWEGGHWIGIFHVSSADGAEAKLLALDEKTKSLLEDRESRLTLAQGCTVAEKCKIRYKCYLA